MGLQTLLQLSRTQVSFAEELISAQEVELSSSGVVGGNSSEMGAPCPRGRAGEAKAVSPISRGREGSGKQTHLRQLWIA